MIWTQKKDNNKTLTYIWLYSSHLLLSYYIVYIEYLAVSIAYLAVYTAYLAVDIKDKAARGAPATAYSEIPTGGGARGVFYVLILRTSQYFTSRVPWRTSRVSGQIEALAQLLPNAPAASLPRASLLPAPSMAILWVQTKSRPAAPRKGPERGARRRRAVRLTNCSIVCRALASILTHTER